jgi:ribosomal-protein-alanine N-acetyltransferase
MAQFYEQNAEHLKPWEPQRSAEYHQVPAWEARLAQWTRFRNEGRAVNFISLMDDRIIAVCNLTNIVRGVYQAANLGYAVAADFEGRGVMQQLCGYVLDYAFDMLNLNRIMANYMPANVRSAKLLARLGFVKEGLARRYLFINGCWEDHVLTALLNPSEPKPN